MLLLYFPFMRMRVTSFMRMISSSNLVPLLKCMQMTTSDAPSSLRVSVAATAPWLRFLSWIARKPIAC